MLKPVPTRKSRNHKEFEFGQCIVIVSWSVTILWITLSFILAFIDKSTNSEVTVTLIKESFGVTLVYFLYQASLKISRNISGVDKDGIPFKIKHKMDEINGSSDDYPM